MNPTGERFFFLGIGGMGMLPLALFLKQGGAVVEGMDDGLTPRAERFLKEAAVPIHEFTPELWDGGTLVVSSAIRAGHPLLQRWQSGPGGLEILRRGELLAKLARGRRLLAIVGSHGKTSTTALLAHLAERENWAADFVIGGLPDGQALPARNRGSEWLIAEVDESDGTIEGFSPEITVFLNFDWDHADRYADPAAMRAAWTRLARRTTGVVIHPQTDAGGLEPDWSEVRLRKVYDDTPADFRARNANAARIAFAAATGQSPAPGALADFPGVWRRQTFHARGAEFALVEDYAHHPREVSAFLTWLNGQELPKPLRVFFQPHRFSRTTRFVDEFVEALSGLDEVFLHSIYGAGEPPDPAMGNPLDAIRDGLAARGTRVKRVDRIDDFPPLLGTFAFVGAGDANEWAPALAAVRREGSRIRALAAMARATLASARIRENEPLAAHTTLRVGGRAAMWVAPASVAELRWILRTSRLLAIPVEIVGNGSNLLVCDEGFSGVVIHLEGPIWGRREIAADGSSVLAGAGLSLPGLARWAAANGLLGFAFLEGIPGTVGGAIRMNAGSMGAWMEDCVERVEAIDPSGRIRSFTRGKLSFAYRSCPELDGLCIIGAVLRMSGKDKPEPIRQTMRSYAARRRASQPGGPSAGCLFRNPEGDSAGRLIDAAGLKGTRIGGVQISAKHANFIQPEPGASAGDVVRMMRKIRREVAERFGVELQPEVKFLGPDGLDPVFIDRAHTEGSQAQ